jgi:tRNA nucleotidyltransferase/poly(A) polymerase
MTPERSLRSLIFFAALFHDIGKPLTRQVEENGRIRFFEHEKVGARLAGETGHRLQLSNSEISRLKTIVFNHLRPLWLAQANQEPGRRAIYRFFRSTEDAGVDICLLSLADMVATYGPGLPQDRWVQLLETIRPLLQTWWEGPKEIVKPESLITGSDLISEFSIEPGPEIGRILEALREAQAAGQVTTRLEALEFAASLIGKKIDFQG